MLGRLEVDNYLAVVEQKNVGMLDFILPKWLQKVEGGGRRDAIKVLEEHSCL